MQSLKTWSTSSSFSFSPEIQEGRYWVRLVWGVPLTHKSQTDYRTEGEQVVFQFSQQHESVLVLVVQLQALQEILVAALVLLFLDLRQECGEINDSDYSNAGKAQFLTWPKMGRNSSIFSFFSPRFFVPPIFSMRARVGLRFKARSTSPMLTASISSSPSKSKMENANSAPENNHVHQISPPCLRSQTQSSSGWMIK